MAMAKTARTALRSGTAVRTAWSMGIVLSVALLSAPHTGMGQASGVNQGGPDYVHAPAGLSPMPEKTGPATGSAVDRMRRAERHKHLAEDTAKLVELSNQLKAEMDRTPEDQISAGVTRKANDIEKLARDIRSWQSY